MDLVLQTWWTLVDNDQVNKQIDKQKLYMYYIIFYKDFNLWSMYNLAFVIGAWSWTWILLVVLNWLNKINWNEFCLLFSKQLKRLHVYFSEILTNQKENNKWRHHSKTFGMTKSNVFGKTAFCWKLFRAIFAQNLFFSHMGDFNVTLQIIHSMMHIMTHVTLKHAIFAGHFMLVHFIFVGESTATQRTMHLVVIGVQFHMLIKMSDTCETFVATRTRVWTFAGMFTLM